MTIAFNHNFNHFCKHSPYLLSHETKAEWPGTRQLVPRQVISLDKRCYSCCSQTQMVMSGFKSGCSEWTITRTPPDITRAFKDGVFELPTFSCAYWRRTKGQVFFLKWKFVKFLQCAPAWVQFLLEFWQVITRIVSWKSQILIPSMTFGKKTNWHCNILYWLTCHLFFLFYGLSWSRRRKLWTLGSLWSYGEAGNVWQHPDICPFEMKRVGCSILAKLDLFHPKIKMCILISSKANHHIYPYLSHLIFSTFCFILGNLTYIISSHGGATRMTCCRRRAPRCASPMTRRSDHWKVEDMGDMLVANFLPNIWWFNVV